MQYIDITPGPEFVAASIKLFEEQKVKSHATIVAAVEWQNMLGLEHTDCYRTLRTWSERYCKDLAVLEAALEALVEQEEQRIRYMDEGIAAAGGKA